MIGGSQLFKILKISFIFAYLDLKQIYRSNLIGPFWATISTSVIIFSVYIIFSIFLSLPFEKFLPHLAIGLVFWNFISNVMIDGSKIFIDSSPYIHNINMPLSFYVLRIFFKNLLILLHSFLIIPPIILIYFFNQLTLINLVLFFFGFTLLVTNVIWIIFIISIIGSKIRDFSMITLNLLQIAFYLTPIIWTPNIISVDKNGVLYTILLLNPFFHLIEVVRSPLISNSGFSYHFIILFIVSILGSIIASYVWRKNSKFIRYNLS